MLTCGKERNDDEDICGSRDSLFDEEQKERNVKYSKEYGASDGIDAIGFSKVVARGCASHDREH